jgi:hypothetical protein
MSRSPILRILCRVAASLVVCVTVGKGWATQPTKIDFSSAPLQMVRGVHPVLTVTIDGKTKAQMLIDTGASTTLLAPGLASRGTVVDICLTESVCLNNLPVQSYSSTYSNSKPDYYNGLIGWDILSKLVSNLDYKAARLSFGNSGGRFTVPFSLDAAGRPQAPIEINGVDMGMMLLDTGSSYVRVTDQQRRDLGAAFVAVGTEVSLTMGAPETTSLSAPLPVCVGAACESGVTLQKANWPAIGGSFFRNFYVTIDGPGRVFRLTPTPQGAITSALGRYGIQLSPDDASRILLIRVGSCAERAGIATSDRLLVINDRRLETLGYLGAMALLEDTALAAVKLLVQSSAESRVVSLAKDCG